MSDKKIENGVFVYKSAFNKFSLVWLLGAAYVMLEWVALLWWYQLSLLGLLTIYDLSHARSSDRPKLWLAGDCRLLLRGWAKLAWVMPYRWCFEGALLPELLNLCLFRLLALLLFPCCFLFFKFLFFKHALLELFTLAASLLAREVKADGLGRVFIWLYLLHTHPSDGISFRETLLVISRWLIGFLLLWVNNHI